MFPVLEVLLVLFIGIIVGLVYWIYKLKSTVGGTIDQLDQEKRRQAHTDEILQRRGFYLTLAHELRTPLQVILTAVQHLESIGDTGDRELYFQKGSWTTGAVKSNVYRLLRTSGNLIDITRLESDAFPVYPERVEMNHLVESVVNGVQHYYQDRQIQISFTPNTTDLWAFTDKECFERILLNLLSNGLKFTPKGGAVRVRIVQDQITGDYVVAVRDTGPGLSGTDAERIFEKYVQLDFILSRNAEGNGLGLALVKQMMLCLGGRVEVTHLDGAGSEFRLRLPSGGTQGRPPFSAIGGYRETLEHRIRIEFEELGG